MSNGYAIECKLKVSVLGDEFDIEFAEINDIGASDYTPQELAGWIQDAISEHLNQDATVEVVGESVGKNFDYILFGLSEPSYGGYYEPSYPGGEWEWRISDGNTFGVDFWKSFVEPFTEAETASEGIFTKEEYDKYFDDIQKQEDSWEQSMRENQMEKE